MLTYKGYAALAAYDKLAKLFHGEVVNLHDVIAFHGSSIDELRRAFGDADEDYLAFCNERGEEPESPT